jgi:magnesium chelatase subunit I
VLTVFREVVEPERTREVLTAFEEGAIVHTGEDVPSIEQAKLADSIPALTPIVRSLVGNDTSPAAAAAAVEFVLEGMHLSKRLNKDAASSGGGTYRAR